MQHRAGFTLVEVFLVLLIIVLITTLGVPALRGTLAQNELKYSADRLRGEMLNTRVQSMEDGQILCLRAQIGGSKLVIARILDTHFTAGLSSRQTTSRFDNMNEYDPFEKGGFTGNDMMEDFILRNPDNITGEDVITLPTSVTVADVITVADERAAYYLGMITSEQSRNDDEMFQNEAIAAGELRLGEQTGAESTAWSAPIFFYPDGSTSTAAILLKNQSGRCVEVRLRGLTGTSSVTAITLMTEYDCELQPERY